MTVCCEWSVNAGKENEMVDFVGAGPGASDLITVRGKELLQEADCVIYAGSLVNPAILSYTRKDCVIYNSAEMHLEQVLKVMEEMEAEGKHTVRLHTGDPSLYGAVREQMDALDERGISYRVCPGVSSFCGAAAALHAEYTLPGVSQSVIITRMEGRTPVPEREKLHRLAVHGATMVLFLSSGMTAQVQEELIRGGYTEETPCAIVYKATWEDEKVVRGRLKELCKLAEENQITRTALIVVGEVLGADYELSRLYDKHFDTGYRTGVSSRRKEDIIIRTATPEDAQALLAIYAPYIIKTAVTFEYEVPSVEAFAGRIAHTLERYPYLIAEDNSGILGYVYAGPLHERPAYDWSVETSIYVRMDQKGRGIGSALYRELEQILLRQGIVNVAACIAYPEAEDAYLTKDSVRFHERMGYRMVGQFHQCAYKFGRWYHMVWMEKQIGPHLEKMQPVIPFRKLGAEIKKGEKA